MYHNLFDSHVHSDNSADARHSVMYLAEQAQCAGLMGMAVTDHAECEQLGRTGYLNRIVQSIFDVAKAKAAFRHRMTFGVGIEVGVNGHLQAAEKLVNAFQFDFVLGSVHADQQGMSYYSAPYQSNTPDENKILLGRYFDDLLDMVDWGGFDSLAHITYPLRSAAIQHQMLLDLEPHREQIDAILKGLAEKGKALEINTSALRIPSGDLMPPLWMLRRFKELGGEYVTIGSDSHQAEHVGTGIQQAMAAMEEVGFDYFAFYRARHPIMLRVV